MNSLGLSLLLGHNLRVKNKRRLGLLADSLCIKVSVLSALEPPLDDYKTCVKMLKVIEGVSKEIEKAIDRALHMKIKENDIELRRLGLIQHLCENLFHAFMDHCSTAARRCNSTFDFSTLSDDDGSVEDETCEICCQDKKIYTCNDCLNMLCSGCFKKVTHCPFCRTSFERGTVR